MQEPQSPTIVIPTEETKQLERVAKLFDDLCSHWMPHDKQVEAIDSIVLKRIQWLALEWGRRTGKSEVEVVIAGLWAQLVPMSKSYYFAPEKGQAREIIWTSQKIQKCIPPNWIDEMVDSDMRVYWAGSARRSSWLKIDGCDKFDAKRGIEAAGEGLFIIDELREIKEEFFSTVITPTLMKSRTPVIVSTTPPDSLTDPDDPLRPHWAIRLFDAIHSRANGTYIHATSYDNPHLDKAALDEQIADHRAAGEEDIVQREYFARRVPKKTGRKFPMLDQDKHKRDHDELMAEIATVADAGEWYAITDPAGGSVWAWNFIFIHPYTRRAYWLDEIDETDQGQMTVSSQWSKALAIITELHPNLDQWGLYYDDAELWFANEMLDKFDISFYPAEKARKSKSEGFTGLRGIFDSDNGYFSTRCVRTWEEFQNYENEKSRDHHVDIGRYLLIVSNYTPNTKEPPKEKTVRDYDLERMLERRRDLQPAKDWTERALDGY